MSLQTGQTLQNRYRIVKLLGQGGFGAVYRAWDTNLKRPCALKENLETLDEARRQFEREATVLANLSHTNLPRVFDHFAIEGQGQYLVMDFIAGEDLEEVRRRCSGNVPEEEALEWIGQICDALAYLHRQNPPIIHRDIKPANIKITPESHVVLVDFGIVKLFNPGQNTTLGARAITPGFSPPEQYGGGITDARSDIYALGATLYALLTCTEPIESIQRSLGEELPAPKELNPQLSPEVDAAIQRAMQVMPEYRFSNISAFKTALTQPAGSRPKFQRTQTAVAQPAVDVLPAKKELSLPKPKSSVWAFLGGAALLAFIVICVFGVYFIFFRNPPETDSERAALEITQTALALRLTQRDTAPPVTVAHTGTSELSDTPSPQTPTDKPAVTYTNEPTNPPADTERPPTIEPQIEPLKGDGLVQLTFRSGDDYMPQLSPDQRHLVSFSMIDDHWQIIEVDPHGSGMRRQITRGSTDYHHPRFSRDGKRLLVAANLDGNFDIYVINFESGEVLQQLTRDNATDMTPDWLPDERSFVFMSERDGDYEIYLGSMDGSPPKQLTHNDDYDGSCAVSPDGRFVVFYSTRDGNPDIYLMELSSGDTRRLTDYHGRDAEPAFSPDGEWIAFESDRSGAYDIYAVRLDGSGLHRVTNAAMREQVPGFSPDGKWVLFQGRPGEYYNLYRVPWQ